LSSGPAQSPIRDRPSDASLYWLLSLMVFFWAANFVIGKIALRELPPFFVAGMRTILSGFFIWPVYFWNIRRNPEQVRWTWADVPKLVTTGILGVVLNQCFFVIGLSLTTAAHAAIVISMVPMLVLLAAAAMGQEQITKRKTAGMAIAAAGVALLQMGRSAGRGPSLLGDFLIFLSASTFALFTVFGKRLTSRHDTVTINTFAYVGGAVCLLPLTAWQAAHHNVWSASQQAWLSVLYMALFPSVISYLIYSYSLKYLSASRVSSFSYLQPLMATLLAVAVLSEVPSGGFAAGGVLVLGGVYVTERS
jgi:drug/metabolite transporter (DMT)-like permease